MRNFQLMTLNVQSTGQTILRVVHASATDADITDEVIEEYDLDTDDLITPIARVDLADEVFEALGLDVTSSFIDG